MKMARGKVSQKTAVGRKVATDDKLIAVADEIRERVAQLFTEHNLELVEQFGTELDDHSLLAMNEAGELFTWNDMSDKLQPVTLVQSVRFHAREQEHSYEGTHNPEVRKRWLLLVAKALEGRAAR